MTYCLGDAVIESVKPWDDGVAGDPPLEELSFHFGRLVETYTSSAGTFTAGWNLATNAGTTTC